MLPLTCVFLLGPLLAHRKAAVAPRRATEDDVLDVEVAGAKLSAAMGAMSTAERYEAVVLSVLVRGELEQALAILAEEPKGLTPRVAKGLVEQATSMRNAAAMGRAVSASRRQFRAYGSEKAPDPSTDASRRARLLASEKVVETDARGLEIGAAVGAMSVAISALATAGIDTVAGWDPTAPDVVLAAMALLGGLDVWKNEGKLTTVVGSGMSRLATDDPRREAEAEAAAFLVGYLLGVPAFAFKPTAYEAFKLLVDVDDAGALAEPSAVLAWLAAPVAAESNTHRKLVVADPRQALSTIQLADDRGVFRGKDADIPHIDRLKWATRQARTLLNANAQLHRKLTDCFEARSASPADAVAIIEQWAV